MARILQNPRVLNILESPINGRIPQLSILHVIAQEIQIARNVTINM